MFHIIYYQLLPNLSHDADCESMYQLLRALASASSQIQITKLVGIREYHASYPQGLQLPLLSEAVYLCIAGGMSRYVLRVGGFQGYAHCSPAHFNIHSSPVHLHHLNARKRDYSRGNLESMSVYFSVLVADSFSHTLIETHQCVCHKRDSPTLRNFLQVTESFTHDMFSGVIQSV